MGATLNRKDRRRISKLVNHIDRQSARVELIQIARHRCCTLSAEGETSDGKDFAVCIDPYGIRYGEREADGFCTFDAYDAYGDHLFGWGGDGYDLPKEVSRSPQQVPPHRDTK